MARKPKHEEHENHERWLVSYADFITLLFAFFVVMYSISSVNEGKYRVLSSALVTAFSHPQKTIAPIQYGTPLRSPILQHESLFKDDDFKGMNTVDRPGVDHQIVPTPQEMADMQKIADEISYLLKDLIDKQIITVTKTNLGVEIEIKSKILFASGVAVLSSQAISPLRKIAAVLGKTSNDINVEGYTDNVPISNEYFPSNWELSAARAASVVRLFAQSGIDPNRLKAIGFAEHKPVADNSTEAGRSKNRRVAILVLNNPEEKRVSVGLNKREHKKDSNKIDQLTPIHTAVDGKPKTLPIKSLGSPGGEPVAAGSPKLLPSQPRKPAITTLPLDSAKSKPTDAAAEGRRAQPASKQDTATTANPSDVLVKPVQPINLPVLQVLPNKEGDSK
jgi:chemotaxis protein MotB